MTPATRSRNQYIALLKRKGTRKKGTFPNFRGDSDDLSVTNFCLISLQHMSRNYSIYPKIEGRRDFAPCEDESALSLVKIAYSLACRESLCERDIFQPTPI